MKKILLFLCALASAGSFAQTFSTGTMSLSSAPGNTSLNYSAKVDVDASSVTLTLTGPSDRWMGIGFGTSGMMAGGDVVIYDGSDLTDRTFEGIGVEPSMDTNQDWTIESDEIVSGTRTVIGTRSLTTADAADYEFAPEATSITLVYARGQSIAVGYHGADSCGSSTAQLTLGTDTFSIAASKVYPNPSNGSFTVESPVDLDRIAIYTHTGQLVKTLNNDTVAVNSLQVDGLASGIYLLELANQNATTWKKIIVK